MVGVASVVNGPATDSLIMQLNLGTSPIGVTSASPAVAAAELRSAVRQSHPSRAVTVYVLALPNQSLAQAAAAKNIRVVFVPLR